MALAIESDFLNVKPPKSQDSSARGSETSRRGEAFADTLSKARSQDAEDDVKKTAKAESDTGAFVLPPPPPEAEPDLSAPGTEGKLTAPSVEIDMTAPAAPVAEADMAALADPALGSELETDRDLAEARVETEVAAPPEAPDAPVIILAEGDLAARAPESMTDPKIAAGRVADVPEDAPAEAQTEKPLPIAGEAAAQAALAAGTGAQKGVATDKADAADSVGEVKSVDGYAVKLSETAKTSEPPQQAGVPIEPAMVTDIAADEFATAALVGSGNQTSGTDLANQTAAAAPAVSLIAGAPSAAPSAPVITTPVMTPTHAVLTASPADVVDIVARSAADGKSDSVVVQLDPPELGRVSIDFKFDAQGLQHITITGETPEALRQLRLMHFELTQALERQGLGSHTMTFQQQHQNAQSSPTPMPFGLTDAADDSAGLAAGVLVAADMTNAPRSLPGGRLDIRL